MGKSRGSKLGRKGIVFRYSRPYDEMLGMMMGKQIADSFAAKEFLQQLEALWKKEGDSILREIERASGLKFREKLDCYVVQQMLFEAISHPFTVRMHRHVEKMRGILVHELMHILLVQHGAAASRIVNSLDGGSEFKMHFPVLLCERRVLEKLYGGFQQEKRGENLDEVWKAVNKVYPAFQHYQHGVLRFVQDVARGKI